MIQFAERNPWPQDPEAFARQAEAARRARQPRAGRRREGPVPGAWSASATWSTRRSVAADLAGRLPSARMVVLPDVGHIPHVEDQSGVPPRAGAVPRSKGLGLGPGARKARMNRLARSCPAAPLSLPSP